jgi:peptidoglycan/LPS O-acetylase OafA/YrhL
MGAITIPGLNSFSAAAVILSLIAATLSFTYVEKPTRQIGRRVIVPTTT